MTHPKQFDLALFAGQDLGRFARWRTERHLAGCMECRIAVRAFASVTEEIAGLNELPAISWNRLAAEMKANIRLGLAAGECVRGEMPMEPLTWFAGVRGVAACASVMAMLAAGLFLQRPTPSAPAAMASERSVLRATSNGIEVDQGGQTLSLWQVSAGEVTYSAGAQGSMGAGYVDSETGNVTINKVYVQ